MKILMLFHDFADLDESIQYWFLLQPIYTMDLTRELIYTNSSFGFVGLNKLIRKIHGVYNTCMRRIKFWLSILSRQSLDNWL